MKTKTFHIYFNTNALSFFLEVNLKQVYYPMVGFWERNNDDDFSISILFCFVLYKTICYSGPLLAV